MRLASNGSVVRDYLKSRKEATLREAARDAANKAKAVNESKVDILGSKLSTARNIKALDEFKMNTRKTLLEMAIGAVFEEIIHEQHGDTRDMSIGKNVISEFVNEFGYDKLARNMLEQNLITSQMIGYCEEYYDKIVTEAVAKNKKKGPDEDHTFVMDKEVATAFLNDIEKLVPGKVITTIRGRVADSMQDFIDQQTQNKADIMEIYSKANDHAKQTKAKLAPDSAEAPANESVFTESVFLKQRANKIYNRPTNVLGAMVHSMCENTYKDNAMKQQYLNESGNTDMRHIINDCAVIYTALETMNTLGVHQFDGPYIQKMLKESVG